MPTDPNAVARIKLVFAIHICGKPAAGNNLVPVSYTHLDVYKRQLERRCAGQGKRFYVTKTPPTCADMDGITLDKLVACLESGSGAVDISVDEDAARAAQRTLCLLYTSTLTGIQGGQIEDTHGWVFKIC